MDGDVSKMENIIKIREGKKFAHQIQVIQPIENDNLQKRQKRKQENILCTTTNGFSEQYIVPMCGLGYIIDLDGSREIEKSVKWEWLNLDGLVKACWKK